MESVEIFFKIPKSYLSKELDNIDMIQIQEIKLKNDKERVVNMSKKRQKRVCVINYKGGVGKSTIALSLAAGLSRENKVLLVDVDHQANLSRVCLGSKDIGKDNSIAAIFQSYTKNEQIPGLEIIHKAPLRAKRYPNLDLLPSIEELDEFEFNIAETTHSSEFQQWDKKTLICRWIDENDLEEQYDYIIFDCPPATMYITQNALAASHSYVVPIIPSELSMRGLLHLIHMINDKIYKKIAKWAKVIEQLEDNAEEGSKIYRSFNGKINLAAVVLSMVQVAGNTNNIYGCTDVHQHGIDVLRQWEKKEPLLKDKVLYDCIVYKRTEVESSMGEGLPVLNHEYRKLVQRLAKLI